MRIQQIYPAFILVVIFLLAGCGVLQKDQETAPEPQQTEEAPAESAPVPSVPEPQPAVAEPTVEVTPVPDAVRSEPQQLEPEATAPAEPEATAPVTSEPEPPVAADSAPAAKPASVKDDIEVPAKKGPNHFVITRHDKGPDHPAYGKGHTIGFYLDGKPGTPTVLRRGTTYEFDVRTDPLHDVYFSATPVGWGGGPIIDGVKGQFTYNGTITINPGETTPNIIYYSCRNHSTMGWKIYVVDKGAPESEVKKILADAAGELQQLTAAGAGTAVKKDKSDAKARQKLSLAGMMLGSGGVKRVMSSNDDEAKGMITQAKARIDEGNTTLKSGAIDKAMGLADAALKLISTAQRLVPTEEELKEQENEYNANLITVEQFEISHQEQYDDTVKRRGKAAAVSYDKAKISQLVTDAKAMAGKKKYVHANENLVEAEHLITSAIQQMMDKQEIVYELNFKTPKDEYDYEKRRYKGYADLIPVALEQKQPNDNLKKLMDMYVKKSEEQKAAAEDKAKAGDYPTAISMILSATEEMRRALRTVGVTQ